MWVKGAGPSFEVNVQQADTDLSLFIGKLAGDHRTFSSIGKFLNIKIKESFILREGYKIDW